MNPSTPNIDQHAWSRRDWFLIILAFSITYFVWGSTYLANAWAVKVIPPFLLGGCRFFLAGLIMFVISIFIGRSKATKKQWINALFAGVLLFVIGNGLLVWSLQFMDSGITALLVAFEPLVVVLLQWKMRGQIPNWLTMSGIALGVIGMGLLVGQDEFLGDSNWMIAFGMICISILAWAYVSVWLPKADLPANNFLSASMQMLCGGAVMMIVAIFTGDYQNFDSTQLDQRAIWAFVFLVTGGSIAAFTAFTYLLKTVSPEKVVTNAYVNPVVALFLGWLLNQESISQQSLIASVLLITAVIVINSRKRTSKIRT